MPAAEVPPAAWIVQAPARGPRAVLRRRSGRFVLTLPGGLAADLGRAPKGRLEARRGRWSARFATPAGKRRVHRLTGRTLTVAGARVLASADGFAFRPRRGEVTFSAARGTRAWLQAYGGAYEKPYRGGALAARRPGRYAFPALLRRKRTFTLLTEAPAGRDAVSHLRLRRGRSLRVELARGQERPARTPWRIAVSGDLARVAESDLPLALGRPSRVGDTSWIEPGRSAWSWLRDHSSPERLETQKEFVDLAAEQGWEYVTVDEGWRPEWIRELIAYAAERGVRVILWYDQADLSAKAVRRAARWGAAGVKADFFYSDSTRNLTRMDDIARWTARRRLVVAFHGCTIPRGMQRTWPHVLTLEAVRGAEHGPQPRRDDVNAALIRGAVGSTDYTPDGDPVRAIVFESGLQHYGATGPLLDEIPAAWDDTRLLAGAPDRHVVMARRAGERWFVAGLVSRPISFALPPGRFVARFADGSERPVAGRMRARGDFAAVLSPAG